MIERIAFGCLAGNDEFATKRLEDRADGDFAYRHYVFSPIDVGLLPQYRRRRHDCIDSDEEVGGRETAVQH
jgi:hypothetical protein